MVESALVSSVVAFNLALTTRSNLPELQPAALSAPIPTLSDPLTDMNGPAVSQVVSVNLAMAVELLAAKQAAATAAAEAAARARSTSPTEKLFPRLRSPSPEVLLPAKVEADGSVTFTSEQLKAVEVVVEEVRSALLDDGDGAVHVGRQQEAAVERWSTMIKASPQAAADAVAEVRRQVLRAQLCGDTGVDVKHI